MPAQDSFVFYSHRNWGPAHFFEKSSFKIPFFSENQHLTGGFCKF